MSNIIKIETGDVTFDIQNENGDVIGNIRFNPSDFDLMRRADVVEKWFSDTIIPDDLSIEGFYEFCDNIQRQFDYLLNRPVSKEIFKVCNPLTILGDGRYYFVEVLKVIIEVIRKETAERTKRTEERVNEAVAEITSE